MTAAVDARPDMASVPPISVASTGARAMLMGTPRPPSIWEAISTPEVRRRSRGRSSWVTAGAGRPVSGEAVMPYTPSGGAGRAGRIWGLGRRQEWSPRQFPTPQRAAKPEMPGLTGSPTP